MRSKICTKCGEEKPLGEFYSEKTGRYGYHSWCKECAKKDQRKRYSKVKKKQQKYMREQRQLHKEKFHFQDWKHAIKYKFGMTPEQYNVKFKNQRGRCAICGRHQSELKRRLAIHHDHITGKIGRLLCGSCNINLGWYEKRQAEVEIYLKGMQNENESK